MNGMYTVFITMQCEYPLMACNVGAPTKKRLYHTLNKSIHILESNAIPYNTRFPVLHY